MVLAIDVHYKETYTKAVGVLFDWQDTQPQQQIDVIIQEVADYVPGEFYKRELPCLLRVIEKVDLTEIEAIIVDGHVFIDNVNGYGLGAHLWAALNEKVPVIGVAKRAFHANEKSNIPVLRGDSKNPLYVSAIGADVKAAAGHIKAMKGDYRMPAVLQLLDTETKKG